ncbi:hypothetical protein [uncultured Maricaulis sp.]|uniref:hypothetical protein n=1 Tax=uncultured Maricaulis sp. TaxID=174710 RepID=UPI002630CAF8|nr:hypothetical protein [uncultured Maricaulis sp.]
MNARTGDSNPLTWLVVALLAALTILAAWILAQRDWAPPLERSALGFDGLVSWLNADAIETRRFLGQGPLSGEGVGLRILPLYDPDPGGGTGRRNLDPEAPYLADTLRAIPEYVVATKVKTLPTLVVLPKWRDGVRLLGVTHPEFLIHRLGSAPDDQESVDADLRQAEPADESEPASREGAEDIAAGPAIQTFIVPHVPPVLETGWSDVSMAGYLAGEARLRAPQWMVLPEGCAPLVGAADRALLAHCRFDDLEYWVLSDPDLLNNHGLANGQNGNIARALVRALAGDGDVLLDYSKAVFLTARPEEHERSWSDIARMFEPPFTWLWLAAGGLLALLLWRAGIRGRPLLSIFDEGHGAVRRVALKAQARLMRNAHADGALVRTLVTSRRQALAEVWLGRDRKAGHAFERAVALLRLKDASLADRLTEIFTRADALPDRVRTEVAIDALADVEDVYKLALELA